LPNDANGPNIQSWNITNILIGDSLIPNSGNVTLGSTIYNQHIAGDIYLNTSTSGSFDVIYSVVPTSINNCIGELFTITITVHPNPIANFTDICGSLPATLTNTSIGAVNYYWDMGDGSPILTSKDISYIYTIMDSMFYNIILIAETEFGCLDTASKIFTPPLLFYVPNTFTPDGDEFNNTFIPVFSNKNKVESIHLLIYNRWGEIVFESENIDFGWDGTYKNRIAQDGTYAWELIFTNNSCIGKKEHLYGHVNLIR
jgi:gliding motility-associated-like protein